jgi:hypothetical protein
MRFLLTPDKGHISLFLYLKSHVVNFQELTAMVENRMKEGYLKKFRNGRIVVLNMSLVMLCTVMELFFEHAFKTIFLAKPETLLIFSKDKNLMLKQILDFKTYNGIIEEFRNKCIDDIICQETKKILEAFNSLGIKSVEIFSRHELTAEAQERLKSMDKNTLIETFNKRHSIVHDNTTPVANLDEFLLIKDFFEKIIMNVSLLCHRKFKEYGLILDFHEILLNLKQDDRTQT